MNNLFKFSIVAFLSFFIISCSEDSIDQSFEQNDTDANKEMVELLESKYGVTTKISDNGNFQFTYPDGRILNATITNESVIISGTRLNKTTLELQKLTKEEIDNYTNSRDNYFLNSVEKEDFISTINNVSNLEIGLYKRPCDEHPSNEEFDDCFKREWDEFCDGFVGCLAQATNPVLVAAVIAGHCAAC